MRARKCACAALFARVAAPPPSPPPPSPPAPPAPPAPRPQRAGGPRARAQVPLRPLFRTRIVAVRAADARRAARARPLSRAHPPRPRRAWALRGGRVSAHRCERRGSCRSLLCAEFSFFAPQARGRFCVVEFVCSCVVKAVYRPPCSLTLCTAGSSDSHSRLVRVKSRAPRRPRDSDCS